MKKKSYVDGWNDAIKEAMRELIMMGWPDSADIIETLKK